MPPRRSAEPPLAGRNSNPLLPPSFWKKDQKSGQSQTPARDARRLLGGRKAHGFEGRAKVTDGFKRLRDPPKM